MSTDSDVQLNVEGSGPHVATLAVDEPQPVSSTGAAVADVTVHQQVVSIADATGSIADDPTILLSALVAGQERTNELLDHLIRVLS